MKDQNPRTQLDLNITQIDKNMKISKYRKNKKIGKLNRAKPDLYPWTSQLKLRRASDCKLYVLYNETERSPIVIQWPHFGNFILFRSKSQYLIEIEIEIEII